MTKLWRKTFSGARLLPLSAAAMMIFAAGCRQDMQNQPKMIPQRGSDFFASHRSVRPQVDHTVARGQLGNDSFFATGILNGKEADLMPFPVTMHVLARGQERFNIYCTPCHSRVGNGVGMIVERGYKPAANFDDPDHLAEPLGHFFYVMTHGIGAMPSYAAQLTPSDRWAVAAYIRALQLSQNASRAQVPPGVEPRTLQDIAQQEGYPARFAQPWALPTDTNATAEPHPTTPTSPGMAPASGNPPSILTDLPAPADSDASSPAPAKATKPAPKSASGGGK